MPTVKSEYLMGIAKYAQERRNFTIRSIDLANIRAGNPLKGCDGIIIDTDESDIIERESTATYPVNPPWLAKAPLLLDSNLDKPISAADLANAVGVSQTALQNSFRKAFGTTVGKYILSAKMHTARRLLGEEGLSVKEVAAKTGFSTPNYFCQTYHAFYGHPPSAERPRRNVV